MNVDNLDDKSRKSTKPEKKRREITGSVIARAAQERMRESEKTAAQ